MKVKLHSEIVGFSVTLPCQSVSRYDHNFVVIKDVKVPIEVLKTLMDLGLGYYQKMTDNTFDFQSKKTLTLEITS